MEIGDHICALLGSNNHYVLNHILKSQFAKCESGSGHIFSLWSGMQVILMDLILDPSIEISQKFPIFHSFWQKSKLPGVCEKQVCKTRPGGRVWENTPAHVSITEIRRSHEW